MADATGGHFHAVRFYEDDESLSQVVARFIAEGVALGQPALIIATQGHRDAIVDRLTAAGVSVEALKAAGDLVLLDAHATLATFMVNGMPDPGSFNATAACALETLARGRTIRAYGEMVDLLCQDGLSGAAIALEVLWNRLAATHDFSLLCGYAMGHFDTHSTIEGICRQHTHVFSDNGEIALVS